MGKTEIQETGKTWTKSTKVSWRRMQTRAGFICALGNGLRFCRLNNGSCMSREAHVQFCEGLVGKFRWSTLLIVCFECEEDAKGFGERLRQRLGKFGLKVSEEKSRIIEFGRKAWQRAQEGGGKVSTFNFLGFTYYGDKTRKGTFKVGRKTNSKKMSAKLKAMNQWLKSIRNAIEFKEWWPILKQKLIGHYRYYGISGNMKGLRIFYSQSVRLAYKWINRRSQKKSFNWEKYRRLIYEWNPLPQPKIYHLTYTLSSKRKCY